MSAGNASLSGSPTTQQHYHAFLSHNGADKPSVEQLGKELEKRGLYCWLDNITGTWFPEIPGNPPSKKPSANATAAWSSLALMASVHGTTKKCAWPSGATSMRTSVSSSNFFLPS
jgi:hypothetical protein